MSCGTGWGVEAPLVPGTGVGARDCTGGWVGDGTGVGSSAVVEGPWVRVCSVSAGGAETVGLS